MTSREPQYRASGTLVEFVPRHDPLSPVTLCQAKSEAWARHIATALNHWDTPIPAPVRPRWRCICTAQGLGVYSGGCPLHDHTVDTEDAAWRQMYTDHLDAQERIKERLGW